jgi:hypothetical protein
MSTILISDSQPIRSIQNEFTSQFPFLKIEFFSHFHKTNQGSAKKDLISSNFTLKQARKSHLEGSLEITPSMTVSELERKFQLLFGLSVQVFRKSGSSWLETTVTDSWTLEQQNEQGRELSNL